MNLLKVLRLLSLYCIMGILLLCSIKNDNGNPVSTGPSTSTGPNNQIANPVIIVTPDSQYVGIRETLSIAVTVMQDSLLTVVYSGAKVYCIANTGWFSAESLVTDSKGRAILKIMDTIQTKVLINLACGNTKQSFSITVTNTPNQIQNLLTITPARAVIKADGKDTTTVQVSLKNLNNNPVSGQCIQFITSAGMIAGPQTGCSGLGQVASNAQGVASATLTSANVNDTAFVTAFLVSDMTKTVQTRVVFSGVTVLLTADSTNLKPGSTETINAFFVNASNNPIAYAPVYFSIGNNNASNISFVSKDTITGPDGYAHCVINGMRPGTDSVRVVGSGAAASIKMNITNLSLAVSLDAKVLQAQASLSTLLHVVFTSSAGSPIANNPVILKRSYQTANGNDTSDILTATTNAQGKCVFTINVLPYECSMSLTASASTGTDMASAVTSISFLATRNVTINAIPTVIQADGTSNSTITVQVKTLNNNPIIGDQINFTATAGLVTASAKTDTNGRAVAVLTSDRRNTIATVKATLAIDTTVVKTVQVGFTGVSIAASANPQSISSSGKDSSVITATLIDAAKNPIVGEPIYFSKLQDSTVISSADTVTNNRGVAQFKVSGTGSGIDTIKIIAAGDSQKVAINYSSNYLSIDTVAGQSCIANGIDSTRILIKYFAGNKTTFIPSASLAVSVTLGSISNSVVFAKQLSLVPADSGKLYFYMKNPGFANTATISVVATTASEMTTASYSLYFGSTKVRKIVLTGSPSVVATNGSKVSLTGVAFDSLGNRVSGELIAFNLISGPGAAANILIRLRQLRPPTAR